MRASDLTSMKRPWGRWMCMGAAGLIALAIAGCGGGGGGGTTATSSGGTTTGGGTTASQSVTTPTGTAIDAATLSASEFAALAPSGAITSVAINSPPTVTFQITDASGRGIKGLGYTSQTSTAKYPGLSNLAFTIAKLVPGTDGSPSKWISYVVTTSPTTTTGETPTRPSTDNIGTLVDNGDGTYKYTFYRDITKVKDLVAAATVSAPNNTADLGDLTYDPTQLHRVAVQLSGVARGTGTNTSDGSNSGVTAVPMQNPLNLFLDFWPATGKVATATDAGQREIVKVSACFECHGKFTGFHATAAAAGVATQNASARQDTKMCVLCHTDQRRYGRTEAVAGTTTTFDSTKGTYLVDGRTVGWLPNYVHKIHMGERLTKTGYSYAGVQFNEVTYPQTIQNCVKCHDGSASAPNKTAQGDNWKNVPSRVACGSCHDGINFATGKGLTLADAENGLTTSTYGHVGGIQTDDKNCALCHSAAAIPVYHVTVDAKGSADRGGYPVNTADNVPTVGLPAGQGPAIALQSQINSPAGVYKMDYEIKQVTVTGAAGAKKPTVVYRILKDGQPVTLNATGFLITGVDGTPNITLAWAVPQDGIASPSDWNFVNDLGGGVSIKSIRDGLNGHSQTGPDASGYYTATLNVTVPDNATMVTAAMPVGYQGFVQLNHPDYPKGIRLREAKFVMKTADGYSARRAVVDADKCNKCHGQLGVSPSFHSGARNNGAGCALCHNPNRATGHVGLGTPPLNPYYFGGGWFVGAKNLIHSIHGSAKREQAFNYLATPANPDGFKEVTYPGVLKTCETCHLSGTYDFSAAASSAALPNLLWATDVAGNMTNDATTNPTGITPVGQNPWVKLIGAGEIDYRTNNLVSSPIASSCFGCHDSSLAVQHMQSNGGTLLKQFSTVVSPAGTLRPAVGATSTMTFNKTEQCMLCHATGKVADIKAMHAK